AEGGCREWVLRAFRCDHGVHETVREQAARSLLLPTHGWSRTVSGSRLLAARDAVGRPRGLNDFHRSRSCRSRVRLPDPQSRDESPGADFRRVDALLCGRYCKLPPHGSRLTWRAADALGTRTSPRILVRRTLPASVGIV